MFEQPQNPSSNPLAPKKPSIGEPEDILNDIDPVSVGITKKMAPPPSLGSIAGPFEPKEKTFGAKDIFSTMDPSPQKPGMPEGLKIKKPTAQADAQTAPDIERRKPLLKSKIFITVIAVALGAGSLGVAGFYVYSKLTKDSALTNISDSNELFTNTANLNTENVNASNANINSAPAMTPTAMLSSTPIPIDSDLDGLSNDEEKMYGTDPAKADTDEDGLTDRDEIKTWKTDPLKQDTDGDGFKDGEEVRNKYDPLGPGRLIEIPK